MSVDDFKEMLKNFLKCELKKKELDAVL